MLKGPVRSRLIDGQDSMMPQYAKSSPKHIQGSGRGQGGDRWDATKSPEKGGSWKGHKGNGVVSPDSHQKNGAQRSRWVKMEDEESWRKDGNDERKREPRYAWGGSSNDDKTVPEWEDVNPNQEVQMTADVIEVERQKMQALWRKELEEKKAKDPDAFVEIGDDEIERWKKEQQEQDKSAAPHGVSNHERMTVHRNEVGPAQGRQVNLQNLFASKTGAQDPVQDISAQLLQTQISTTSAPPLGMLPDQGKNLLAMLHAGARPPAPTNTIVPPPGMRPPPGMPILQGAQPFQGGMPRPPPGMFPPNMMPPPPHVVSNGMSMPQGQSVPQLQSAPVPQNYAAIRPGQQINVAALFGSAPGMPPQQQQAHQSSTEVVRSSSQASPSL